MERLRAMELLVSAIREGSFSAAGRRRGLSPASVSRQIGELETLLGVQLVQRSTRQLSLTEAGRAYVQRIEQVLHGIGEAEAAAAALQTTPKGLLRVNARMMFGMTVLTPLIPQFQKAFPDLHVELRLSEQAVALREEQFDIDFRISPPREPDLMQRKLFSSERILVASPDYIARMPSVRAPADLMGHNCLTYWLGPDTVVWRFMREGRLEELPVPFSFAANNGYVLRDLARLGHGIALLDDYTVRDALADGSLQRLLPAYRVTNTTFDIGIYATFLEARFLPEKIRVFLDFVSDKVNAQSAREGKAAPRLDRSVGKT